MTDRADIARGWHPDPARSLSLRSEAYLDPFWFEVEQRGVFGRSWQWVTHGEAVRESGEYVAATVAGLPVFVVRGRDGELRGFHNVCKHRAHDLVSGRGSIRSIVCPYHAWSYDLTGCLTSARHTGGLVDFDPAAICLDAVAVEEFGGFVYANLDPRATSLAAQTGALGSEIERWAPDVERPDLRPSPRLRHRRQLEERHRQLPRVLPLPGRAQGLRLPRRHGYLPGHDPRHLLEPHGRGRKVRQQRVRRRRRHGHRPCGVVVVAQHVLAAVPGAGQLHRAAGHPGGSRANP